MPKMRAAEVEAAKGKFRIVEREIQAPGRSQVRIKVQACGICHSDSLTKEGLWPGVAVSRACPGTRWSASSTRSARASLAGRSAQRVGVGWHGGHCGYCDSCRRGNFFACQVAVQITRHHVRRRLRRLRDRSGRCARAGPRRTLGRTTPRRSCARASRPSTRCATAARAPGDLVAVLGIGGLGHLGVQFAAKMGFRTVGDRPREGQGGARPEARRASLRRQPGAGSGRGADRSWAEPRSSWRR